MSNVTVATEEPEEGNYGPFNKRLGKLLHKSRVETSMFFFDLPELTIGLISVSVVPTLLQDIIGVADKWGNNGKSGRIDPFVEIYEVCVFLRESTLSIPYQISLPFPARLPHDRSYGLM
jgi:hypothetical protein